MIDLLLHHGDLLASLFLIGRQDQIQVIGAHLDDAQRLAQVVKNGSHLLRHGSPRNTGGLILSDWKS